MVVGLMAATLPKHFKIANLNCSVSRSTHEGLVVSIHKHAFTFGNRLYSRLFFIQRPTNLSLVDSSIMRPTWSIRSSADGSGFDPSPIDNNTRGTRLIRAIRGTQIKVLARIQELRKNLPMKVLFFLVGFYCATAFATVIGQTGDWDILSAAFAVFVVEAIGALMYKGSLPFLGKVKSLITMFNYWKAGLSMGLFLDSFKYEIENIMALCDLSGFEIDIFRSFL